jgi:hypothetical protein
VAAVERSRQERVRRSRATRSATLGGDTDAPIGSVSGEGALVLFSGGQDSTVRLAWAPQRFVRVETLGFNYGQRSSVRRVPICASAWGRSTPNGCGGWVKTIWCASMRLPPSQTPR